MSRATPMARLSPTPARSRRVRLSFLLAAIPIGLPPDMTAETQLLACRYSAPCSVRGGCRARATTTARYTDDQGRPLKQSAATMRVLDPGRTRKNWNVF